MARYFRLYPILLCMAFVLSGCEKIVLPEAEDTKDKTEQEQESDAPPADGEKDTSAGEKQDEGEDQTDDGQGGGGDDAGETPKEDKPDEDKPYHGFKTLAQYLDHYGSEDNPIPLQDLYPGGCIYKTVVYNEGAGGIRSINDCWIEGYVVGYVNGNHIKNTFFGAGGTSTNVVLAESPDETDYRRCIPVQLKTGASYEEIRNALNLRDNPEVLGKKVALYGAVAKYMSTAGLTKTRMGYLYTDDEAEL